MKRLLLSLSILLYSISGFSQFFEGFENTTGPDAAPSTNWTLGSGNWAVFFNGVGVAEQWKINNTLQYQGANAAYISRENIGIGNTEEDYLATPAVYVPANGQLKFYNRTYTAGDQGTLFQIKVAPISAPQIDMTYYTLLAQYTESQVSTNFDVYEEKTLDLSAYAGQEVYIAFVRKHTQTTATLDGDRWLVDNVSVGPVIPSACPTPHALNETLQSPTSVTFNWTETGNATQWEVLALPINTDNPLDTDSGILTNTTSYTFTNLTEMIYKFYVRAICSATEKSSWSNPSILTIPTCTPPTNVALFNILAFTASASWTAQGNQYKVLVLPTGEPAPTSSSTSGVLVSGGTYNITGLTPSTTYDVYVRFICFGPDYPSEWAGPVTFTTQQSLAPIVTSNSFTAQQLVNNILIDGNPCFTVSNVTSSTGTNFASTNGLGYFTNTNSTFPLSSGIVLSTGSLTAAAGPNTSTQSNGTNSWPGDTELLTYMQNSGFGNISDTYQNATKLEFDFTSLNEFMSFNFLFASEEYGTFQCSFSDAFAFFLKDLDTGITTNLAIVPATTVPISVVTIRDNVNNNSCTSANVGYFGRYNLGSNVSSSATNFNGQTKLMTASSDLISGHHYHIKLVVADRNDSSYDSAVFIEAGSFSVGPPICSDKVQLVAFVDDNNNGVKDIGENNFTHGSFVINQNNTATPTNVSTPFGSYTLYDTTSNTYDFGYAVDSEFSSYYAATATNYSDINIASNPNQILYFPITLTQGFNDVTASIVPNTAPRPGFTYTNTILYRNQGTATTSGTLTFVKDPAVTIININTSGTVSTSDGFSYNFTNLAPNEIRSIAVTMSIPTLPTVALGQILTDTVTISAPTDDINLTNNTFTNEQVIIGSYDPNDKMEAHGGKIQFNQFSQDDYLYYTIRFQNTGSANALDVRIEDILDAQLDETSFEMVNASHNYVVERKGNQLIWKFNYINLVGALESEADSKGYVTFKIKLTPGFAIGDIVPNKARIYFDTNPAIVTNIFNTEFVQSLGNPTFGTNSIKLYPNPASTSVHIIQNENDNLESIRFYDVSGKTVKHIDNIANAQLTIDISTLAKGIYFVEITTEDKLKQIKKLIIQ
jgi:hypothetical protein